MCTSVPIEVGKMPLSCRYGQVAVKEFGLNVGLSNPHCWSSNLPESDCTTIIKESIFKDCEGKPGCSVNFQDAFSEKQGKLLEKCKSSATFWVKYNCQQPEEGVLEKKLICLRSACAGIFACLLFSCALYFLKQSGKL